MPDTNTPPLHLRGKTDGMNEQDMLDIMPKSVGNIAVLTPLKTNNAESNQTVIEAIKKHIQSDAIKHMIIPVGPEHWLGLYLTKLDNNDGGFEYELEVFDSCGNEIAQEVSLFLTACGISDKTKITKITKKEGMRGQHYSSGDFVSAYSHLKMQKFGAERTKYNADLISALLKGNKNGELREATLNVTRTRYPENRFVFVDDKPKPKQTRGK